MTPPSEAPAARQPMPSLLLSLLTDHLDPGYAAAAAGSRAPAGRVWQLLVAVLIAGVVGVALAQARAAAPGVSAARQVLAQSVHTGQARVARLSADRTAMAGEVEQIQRRELAADATGRGLLADLDTDSLSGATTAVHGPGVSVVITDPGAGPGLTDASAQRTPGSTQVILDRDLQLLVNSLWASGAEAVAVGGVRIGPDVTVRQAGSAILVDNQPVVSPYTVLAVGSPDRMPDALQTTSGLERLRLLETAYGVRVKVSAEQDVTLPAAAGRTLTFARQAEG
ncbi:MAG: DUF881 domain-containing protein [Mycobacterium sp.]